MKKRLIKKARKILFGKPRNFTREYLASVGEVELVVHVGAHLGQRSERIAHSERDGWIEGDPETHARLVERLEAAEREAHRPIDHVALCPLVSDTNEQQ